MRELRPEGRLAVEQRVRVKRVRDYSNGSLRDHIMKAETMEELEELRRLVVGLARARQLSSGTLRKLDKAGAAKARELSTKLIVLPSTGKLVVPKGGIIVP